MKAGIDIVFCDNNIEYEIFNDEIAVERAELRFTCYGEVAAQAITIRLELKEGQPAAVIVSKLFIVCGYFRSVLSFTAASATTIDIQNILIQNKKEKKIHKYQLLK